jgi:hypothetical protein
MKNIFAFVFMIGLSPVLVSRSVAQPWEKHGKLGVSKSNPHYISHADGTPFLWLGDTAWELIHRLSREEVLQYFQDRKDKGFNVIQAVAISEFHNRIPVNYYSDSLFQQNDPLQPLVTEGNNHLDAIAYDYWDHLEYIVSVAQGFGYYIALLPSWGEWVTPRGEKPLFNSPADAYRYGWFISNRLKKYPNIIWILGGDRDPVERKTGVAIWRGMAEGLADGTNGENSFNGKADYNTTFMTYHSYQSSSAWFHQDTWIDFHMWGSYHIDYYLPRSYEQSASDRALKNPKPTVNGEPSYEDHPVNYALPGNGVFGDVDVRNAAYWTFFSGAAGYTYGAHPIWQFADSLRPGYSKLTFRTWQQALDLPGASHIIHLKKLIESRPMENLTPDQSIIISGQGTGANYANAIRGKHHIWIYIPTGNDIKVKTGVITGSSIRASWYDPRTGKSVDIGVYENKDSIAFKVPGISKEVSWLRSGRGCDWVLVLDDASMNFPLPGE